MFAQELSVKEFREATNDLSARTKPRQDNNRNDCALVLIHTLKKGLEFEGWIVGDVKYNDDAYYVYLADGAKHLKIKHPDYQTNDVIFSEYGIGSLKERQIYNLFIVDETKDIINKVYSLGWNLNNFEVSEKAKTFLNMSAKRGDKKAIIALVQLSVGGGELKGILNLNKRLHWINKLLEMGDSACLDSMPGELMHTYACKQIEDGISYKMVDIYKKRAIYTEASKYDLNACQKGYKEAGDDFFLNYIKSNGLPAYKSDVMRLCLDSATTGNTKAMRCLGIIFENGICEKTNLLTASKWYRKIYDSSFSNQSKTDLCRVYGNCRFPIDEESLKFIKHQAEEGLQEALFQLGCMYEEGRNVKKNIEKAVELYKQSNPTIYDLNRHHGAAYRLAKIYYERKNDEEAMNLLRGLDDDELDARYLQAMILFHDARDYKVEAYNILSNLSKKGYQEATDFIKNNY